jgi:serine phosphatase RsbU (regulator of sigma subunit)
LIHYRESGELWFAGAHEDMLVFRASSGRVEAVPTSGTWVGATRDIDEATQDASLLLHDGDVLVLYTDGVIEAENASGSQFGIARLSRELEYCGTGSAQLVRDHLLATVTQFMSEQRDDIALLVARYRAGS